jgi:uncharacterized protein (TIGR01777 family)
MKILVSGATGLVGGHFVDYARTRGHRCVALTRTPSGPDDVGWDAAQGRLDPAALEGFDAVVHLAGENIATGRWTADKKRRIRESRVQGTSLLCQRLAQVDAKPPVLVAASAIGYYGDRADEELDERSAPGRDFLAEVCRDWEQATQPASEAGIRVANARLGVVLSRHGGALRQMLTPFRLGVGGVVGSGRQYMSWVANDDVAAALMFIIETPSLSQAVNVVAPEPATNYEFTKALGRALGRPTLLPMPAFAARLAFGEMADALLLASTRVYPRKLLESGYVFAQPDLPSALRAQLAG